MSDPKSAGREPPLHELQLLHPLLQQLLHPLLQPLLQELKLLTALIGMQPGLHWPYPG